MKTLGLTVSGGYKFNKKIKLTATIEYGQQSYQNRDYLNGHYWFSSINGYYFFNQSYLKAGINYSKQSTLHNYNEFDRKGMNLSYMTQLPYKFSTTLGASYTIKTYQGNHLISGYPRKDKTTRLNLVFGHDKLIRQSFKPQVNFIYTRNKSNIIFNDYHDKAIFITIDKQF